MHLASMRQIRGAKMICCSVPGMSHCHPSTKNGKLLCFWGQLPVLLHNCCKEVRSRRDAGSLSKVIDTLKVPFTPTGST